MKILKLIFKETLYPACAIFTAFAFILLPVFGSLSRDVGVPVLTIKTMILFLIMSFLIACSNHILRIKKITLFPKILLHLVLCIMSVVISVIIMPISGLEYAEMSPQANMIFVLIMILVYMLTALPIILITNRIKTKESKNQPYNSVFHK